MSKICAMDLQEFLTFDQATRLPPTVCSFLNQRFQTDLGFVRIHTGQRASEICRRVGARAFTWGNAIVFADGQYRPDEESGRLLLAHELVHVLQQQSCARKPASSFVRIGDPDDEYEAEANRLAIQAVDTGLLRPVTPDFTGALRRTIEFDRASARITADNKGSTPGFGLYGSAPNHFGILHLTRNVKGLFDMGSSSRVTLIPSNASAITLKAQMRVKANSKDNLAKTWEFGFTQLARQSAMRWYYLGKVPADGCIAAEYGTPPAWPREKAGEYVLDVDPSADFPMIPGPRRIAPGSSGGLVVEAEMYDHPFITAPFLLQNDKTRSPNLLWEMHFIFEALTAFIARERATGKIEILAHAKWNFRSHARLKHVLRRGSLPNAVMYDSDFPVPVSGNGPPAEAKLRDKIMNYDPDTSKTFNAISRNAQRMLLKGGLRNFFEGDRWPPNAPLDFATRS